jgi:hypothetical protein
MPYLSRLSGRQRGWLFATVIVMVVLVAVGWTLEPRGNSDLPEMTTAMSIRQIAPKLGATGFAVAKEMQLSRSVDKDTPLAELGIEQAALDETVAHLASHRGSPLKYYVFAALSLFGLVWLSQLGRPDGSPNSERKTWYPRGPYLLALIVSVTVAGFWLGKSPNPMEGAVKIFKGMVGLQPSMVAVILAFIFFVGLAILGNKIICGWACPFGALQELIYSLPILRKLKKRKVPFLISN